MGSGTTITDETVWNDGRGASGGGVRTIFLGQPINPRLASRNLPPAKWGVESLTLPGTLIHIRDTT